MAQVPDIILNEFCEDLDRLTDYMSSFVGRWSVYGNQFAKDLTPEQKDRLDDKLLLFMAKIEQLDAQDITADLMPDPDPKTMLRLGISRQLPDDPADEWKK